MTLACPSTKEQEEEKDKYGMCVMAGACPVEPIATGLVLKACANWMASACLWWKRARKSGGSVTANAPASAASARKVVVVAEDASRTSSVSHLDRAEGTVRDSVTQHTCLAKAGALPVTALKSPLAFPWERKADR